MYPKVNYFLVGLFVVVLGAALTAATFWFATKGRSGAYETFVAYTRDSVAGLVQNAPVKYRGVDVGLVRSIELDPQNSEQVQLLLDIKEGTPVKQDTVAVLASRGFITGLTYIELKGGSRESPPIGEPRPGESYPEIATAPSLFNRIENALPDMLARVDLLIAQLSNAVARADLLLNDDNRNAMANTLASVERLTRALADRSDALTRGIDQLAAASANTARASENLPQLLEQTARTLEATRTGLEAVTRAADRVDRAAGKADGVFDQISRGTLPQADRAMAQLEELGRALERLSRQLEREPGSVVFGRRPTQRGPGE